MPTVGEYIQQGISKFNKMSKIEQHRQQIVSDYRVYKKLVKTLSFIELEARGFVSSEKLLRNIKYKYCDASRKLVLEEEVDNLFLRLLDIDADYYYCRAKGLTINQIINDEHTSPECKVFLYSFEMFRDGWEDFEDVKKRFSDGGIDIINCIMLGESVHNMVTELIFYCTKEMYSELNKLENMQSRINAYDKTLFKGIV